MNCCCIFVSFIYLAIIETTRSILVNRVRDQTVPSNNYGSSDLTRSSSTYGSASNDLVLPRANTGAYYGGSDSGAGSDRYI